MCNKGFSLLELSIVLVIIGLIAGGIVAGSSMIRAAELRAAITELQQYKTAINTFRDKYLGLPGDLKNAGAFWEYPSSSASNCPTTAGTSTETCDGNGDGSIDSGSAAQFSEEYMFWQHLANAGLINGTFTGMAGAGSGSNTDPDDNSPASKLSGATWSVETHDNSSGSLTWPFHLNFGNNLILGEACSFNTHYSRCPYFAPEEAWNIDKKIDDGKPAQGNITIDGSASVANCTTSANDTDFTGDYQLDNPDIGCSMRFIKAF